MTGERGPVPAHGTSGYALVRAIAGADGAGEAVSRLLEAVGAGHGWAAGELWLVDERGEALRCAGGWSREEAALADFRRLAPRLSFGRGVGLPGRAWSFGGPVWIADVAKDPNFPRVEAAERAGLHAAIGLPVRDGVRLLGVVAFYATEVREPDDAEIESMQAAARGMGAYVAQVRAEERLRLSEEVGGSIFEAALDCIVTMDAEGRVLDLNPAAEMTFGYSRAAVRGHLLADLIIPPELRSAHRHALRRYVATQKPTILGRRLELSAVRADGTLLPIELTVTRLGTHEPPTFAGFVRDITARRRMDERLEKILGRERDARLQAEAAEQSARRVSEALQRSLLPPHLPAIPGIELAAAYEAVAEGSVVGGDFYDVFPVADDRWGIVIGDVSGKGADAASLTALIRYTLRTAAVRERRARTVLCVVNDALRREGRDNAYCTLVYAELSLEEKGPVLRLAVAGHPLPLLVGCDGTTRSVGRPGTILGATEDPPFADDEVALGVGETVLLYTDGVTETHTPRGLFGLDGLCGLVRACPGRDPQALVTCIPPALRGGEGHRVADDVALLALARAR